MTVVEFGTSAKDVITGFAGIVTGICQYISGCDQVLLTPKASDGKKRSGEWFDVDRIEVLGDPSSYRCQRWRTASSAWRRPIKVIRIRRAASIAGAKNDGPADSSRRLRRNDRTRTPTAARSGDAESELAGQADAEQIAGGLAYLMWDLGSNNADGDARPWRNPQNQLYYPTGWRVDSQKFYLRRAVETGNPIAWIEFTDARWDPEHSRLDYGEKRIAENVEEHDDAKTKIIRNDTDGEVHVAYDEAAELKNSFSSNVTKGVTLDMSAEVASEQKVSGSYAGVTAEVSLSEKFGVDRSTSKETSTEKAEEGTHSEAIAIDFVAAPHAYYLVTIAKEHERTLQPFDIDGVMDFEIHLHISEAIKGVGRHSKFRPRGHDITVPSIEGLLQFLHGYDVRYPTMEGYWAATYSRARSVTDWIADPQNRRIQVSGVKDATLEKNADYHVEPLGGAVPDHLAELPTLDAEQVAAKDEAA